MNAAVISRDVQMNQLLAAVFSAGRAQTLHSRNLRLLRGLGFDQRIRDNYRTFTRKGINEVFSTFKRFEG